MIGIIENGLICVFDILGYKNFIKNNTVIECAQSIENIIEKLPKYVHDRLLEVFDPKEKEEIPLSDSAKMLISGLLEERLHFVNVSDTIILAFDFTNSSEMILDLFTMVSLLYINIFQETSFEKGFPMRGCVDIGSFYLNNNIFAGDTIINCFIESERLDFSGVILTNNSVKILEKQNTSMTNNFLKKYVTKYIVPLNNNSEENKYLIKWTVEISNSKINDIKQTIIESFHAHNKEVNSSVMKKINNTEKIIRFFHIKK
jgi:hypothetical protein